MRNMQRSILLAAVAGIALAAVSKVVYDLFNGYSTVPNIFLRIGFQASPMWLEVAQFFALGVTAYLVGFFLLKSGKFSSRCLVLVAALPWVALLLFGIGSALLGTDGSQSLQFTRVFWLSWLPPFLALAAVPFGLWLSVARRANDAS